MTDKTEAQPEALRVRKYIDRRRASKGLDREHIHGFDVGDDAEALLLTSDIEALLGRIASLEAQLSARQAAPDGWRLVPAEPTEEMVTAGQESFGVHDCYYAMLSAATPPPEREPQKHDENRELAETAMRFVDRAGDVHPGIDDAARICAEFYAAMAAVIDKWHPMPMPPGIGATNDNP